MIKIGFNLLAWSAVVSDDLLPMAERLKEIGYDGWLTIESFTRDDPDFANSINVWREYNKPWDVAEQGYAFIKQMCEKHNL